MEKRKRPKRTPEVEAARKRYAKDLDERLIEMIERYRKLNAEKRAAESA